MPISIGSRKPQADGKPSVPPVGTTAQPPQQHTDAKDDATTEPPAGDE